MKTRWASTEPPPGPHAQETEVGQFDFTNGYQPLRLQDAGDGGGDVASLALRQEQRMHVDPRRVHEEAGGRLDLLDILGFRQLGME